MNPSVLQLTPTQLWVDSRFLKRVKASSQGEGKLLIQTSLTLLKIDFVAQLLVTKWLGKYKFLQTKKKKKDSLQDGINQ